MNGSYVCNSLHCPKFLEFKNMETIQGAEINIEGNMKMADAIRMNEKLLLVIERFGIALGFGDKTIYNICKEYNLDSSLVLLVMNVFQNKSYTVPNKLTSQMVPGLINYLKNGHHYFLEEKLPYIESIIKQFIQNTLNPDTHLLLRFFNEYANEVHEHMQYEDDIVFPFCTALYNKINGSSYDEKNLDYNMETFAHHHTDLDEKLDDLLQLLIKHFPPTKDRFYRNVMLLELFSLQYDLLDHSNIEDRILLPLVEGMELKVG